MLAADPSSVGTTPALITAVGGAVAAILGAVALFGRRKPSDAAVAPQGGQFDPEDQPARLRERLSALETGMDAAEKRLDNHDEQIGLLRAQEVTTEGLARAVRNAPRKRAPRKPPS